MLSLICSRKRLASMSSSQVLIKDDAGGSVALSCCQTSIYVSYHQALRQTPCCSSLVLSLAATAERVSSGSWFGSTVYWIEKPSFATQR